MHRPLDTTLVLQLQGLMPELPVLDSLGGVLFARAWVLLQVFSRRAPPGRVPPHPEDEECPPARGCAARARSPWT